jgi:hypothetical protein
MRTHDAARGGGWGTRWGVGDDALTLFLTYDSEKSSLWWFYMVNVPGH